VAKKTLSTCQKLVFRLAPSLSKPRNQVVLAARLSGAGSHKKSIVSVRQSQKLALKKTLSGGEPD
jgi:hypothetical protein